MADPSTEGISMDTEIRNAPASASSEKDREEKDVENLNSSSVSEIRNASTSSEKDQNEKDVENSNSSTDPEKMAMNKESSGLQQPPEIPDSAPPSNANNTRFQE